MTLVQSRFPAGTGKKEKHLSRGTASQMERLEGLGCIYGEGVIVAQWVRLCAVTEAPAEGKVVECEAGGVGVCLAKVGGVLAAMDNWCPHRGAALGQGWMEGEAVVCPWHSWAFSVKTGLTKDSASERVEIFPVRIDGDDVMVDLS